MARKIPARDPRASHRRKVVTARRFAPGAKCGCGESRPEAFIPDSEPTICAACDRRVRGRRKSDDHHIAGQANSPLKLSAPINDHRASLSNAQYDWPRKTLENPEASPLLAAAACLRGFVDTFAYLSEPLVLDKVDMLELLDTMQERKLGKKWWKRTKLEAFEPES